MIWADAFSAAESQGALWGTESEDLDATIVHWDEGLGVAAHVNSEVDVAMVVLAGAGKVRVEDESLAVSVGSVVVIPKGSEREVTAGEAGLTYVNVHKRKRKMMPNMVRPRS